MKTRNTLLTCLIISWIPFAGIGQTGAGDTTIMGALIHFDSLVQNYGTVPEGDSVFKTYVFHNDGNAPLEIEDAKPSCNCTLADFNPMPIPPGGRGEIKVIATTRGKSGESNRSVTIISNAENRVIKLELNGYVGPPRGDETNPGGDQKLDLNKLKSPGWD